MLLALGFHGGVLCYWLIIGLQALWRFHESSRRHEREALELMARASALETQVVQARLGALKMQLQPHFLFNTLNAVVSLVRARRGREAEDTLAHLSDLLRWVLDDSEHQEVPLSRELEYVRLYLAVERVRFSDRLRVDMRIAPDALDAAVPHLCLQPIVENAIRHGIEASASAGELVISARRVGGMLELVVEDDGPGFRGVRQPVGIGLANTRLRLAELYGDRAVAHAGQRARRRRHRHADAAVPRVRGTRDAIARRDAARPGGGAMTRGATLDALVVDDEPFARSGLRLLLEDDEDITSIREAASGRAAIDAMAARRPDLVLLDVQMPGMSGFDVVDAVGVASMPGVVFVTAHDRYAVRAFEVNAIDYLLKPVTASRFSEAMARAKARLQTEEKQSAQLSGLLRTVAAPNQYVTRLAARDGGRTTLIDVDTVEWMKAAENYVELHVGRATHLVHVPLTTLCGWLDPQQFIRVHRSIVVATRMIRDLEPSGHGEYEIRLLSGIQLTTGRTYHAQIRKLTQNPLVR